MLESYYFSDGVDKSSSYLFFLICWKELESAYENHLSRSLFLTYPERWEEAKILHAKHEKRVWENNEIDFPDKLFDIFHLSNFKLQHEAPLELIEFYQEIWNQYQPKSLDTSCLKFYQIDCPEYSFVPLEAFAGLCHFIASKRQFGSMGQLCFTNEHLVEWNATFIKEYCLLTSLSILIGPGVKEETLIQFLSILQRKEQFGAVFVRCISFNEQISRLFHSFDPQGLSHIKLWALEDT